MHRPVVRPLLALALALALVLALVGCQAVPATLSEADVQAHRAMSQEFLDHVHAGDWRALSAMYEPDAVVMQMNTPALVGRQAIHDFWAAFPPIAELRFQDDGIVGEGDLAYVHGRYWLTFADGTTDEGKYLDVRRRQTDGSWRYVLEAANTSLPREAADPR